MCDCDLCSGLDSPVGPAGKNGRHAYTVTTNSFTQPAVGSDVTVNVSSAMQYSALGLSVGASIHITGGGYYTLMAIVNANQITVRNTAVATNLAPAGTVAAGATVTMAGAPGSGTAGTNGTNGVAIIDALVAAASTSQTAFTAAQHTVTIPASTWTQNKDCVVYEGLILKEKGTDLTSTLRIAVGGNNLVMNPLIAIPGGVTPDVTLGSLAYRVKVTLMRTDTDKLRVFVEMKGYSSTSSFIGYAEESVLEMIADSNTWDLSPQVLTGLNFAATIPFEVYLKVADASAGVKLTKSILTLFKKS